MPSNRQGFLTGLLLVFMPPVGLICLFILLRDRRLALRAAGEATESVSEIVRATYIAPGTASEPRRPREREPWTKIRDYIG